jgi:hypothetical protein
MVREHRVTRVDLETRLSLLTALYRESNRRNSLSRSEYGTTLVPLSTLWFSGLPVRQHVDSPTVSSRPYEQFPGDASESELRLSPDHQPCPPSGRSRKAVPVSGSWHAPVHLWLRRVFRGQLHGGFSFVRTSRSVYCSTHILDLSL